MGHGQRHDIDYPSRIGKGAATLFNSMRRDGDYGGSSGEDDDGYGWDGIAIISGVLVDGMS